MSFRVGIVKAQDVANARVRVTFPDRDHATSWWLGIASRGAQYNKDFWIPDVGEQVVCLMDEHDEDGCVLGAIFSSADPPPPGMTADKFHLSFKDGGSFEYDRAAHALAVALPAGATLSITANGASIAIDASGNVTIQAAGGINLKTATHNDSVDGMINVFNNHTHPDPSEGNTGAPNQVMS